MWDYPYFTEKEMTCKCGCGGVPEDSFMRFIVTVREDAGFPFYISSGYRCAEYNKRISTDGADGPHVQGLAADVSCFGQNAYTVVYKAMLHGVSGVGVAQKGAISSRFIHLDLVKRDSIHPRPWIWSY